MFGWRNKGGFLGHRKSCHGCSGYSCSGYNCFGSCYGSCTGMGCNGACYGGGMTIPSATNGGGEMSRGGSTWGPPIGMPPYTLHGYNQGGTWGPGVPVVWADPISVYGRVTNINPVPVPKTEPKPMDPPAPLPEPTKMGAKIKFQVPADARLYVDGKLTVLTGTERAFSTPALVVGEKFFYDVKAELMVDGKPVVEEKRVVVEAGADLTESFPTLFAAAQKNGIAVAGK